MGAKFMKAQPQQARLKLSIYGPGGSGKTFTALLMAEGLAKSRGKRVAYADTERGTDFYVQAVKERRTHPEAFDIDVLYTKSLADVTEAIHDLDPGLYGVVVVDSISHLWDAAMQAYTAKQADPSDGIPMQAWAAIKRPYKDLISFLIGSPFDVFILGRQKNVFEQDAEGEMRKTGVAMRAEGETPYEPHVGIRMWAEPHPEAGSGAPQRHVALVEKDRTGVLSGKTFYNPGFSVIAPLLPLLGDVQAPAEDEDERIAKDAALLDKQDEKAAAKEAKSGLLLLDLQAKIAAAAKLEALGGIAEEIKKVKRYLIDSHEAVVRELYRARRDHIVEATARDV